jgi:hypothetical protein
MPNTPPSGPPINPFPPPPIINAGKYRFGRKAVKTDSRTLRLAKYLATPFPPPPPSCDWTKGQTAWGMLLNDTLGDCTIAGALHAIMGWGLNVGTEATFTDQDALNYYEKFDGYNPSDPSTDQGGILLDVLQAWKQQGIDGHTVNAYASVTPTNIVEVQRALVLFGPLYCGLSFPNSAIGAPTWELTSDTSIAGGHCVVLISYNATGPVFISWGGLYQATWEFFNYYFAPAQQGEVYAAISPDWFAQSGVDPTGLDLAQLEADLSAIN